MIDEAGVVTRGIFFYSWWSSMSEEEAQMSGLSHEPWHAMFFLKTGVRRVILDGNEKGCLHQSQGISIWSGVKQTRLPWRKQKKSALQQFQTLSSSVLSEIIATTFVNFCKGGNKMCQQMFPLRFLLAVGLKQDICQHNLIQNFEGHRTRKLFLKIIHASWFV